MTPTITSRLKQLRGSRSQAEFAKEIGLLQQTYARWESGTREPDIKNIKNMAIHFGVKTDWLLGIDDAPPPIRSHDPPVLPSITSADLTNLIEENRDLSAGARAMGEAHKTIANTNAELVRKLMGLISDDKPASKAGTPVDAGAWWRACHKNCVR